MNRRMNNIERFMGGLILVAICSAAIYLFFCGLIPGIIIIAGLVNGTGIEKIPKEYFHRYDIFIQVAVVFFIFAFILAKIDNYREKFLKGGG